MTDRVSFTELARREATDAVSWYFGVREELGQRFERTIEAVFDEIAHHPKRFPIEGDGMRYAPVDPFPYCVYYRIRSNRPIIVSVFHQSRNPEGLRGR